MSNKDKQNDSKKVSIDFYDNDVSNIYKNISNSNYKKNFQRKSTHNIRHNSINANANTRATLNQNVFSDTNLNQSNNDFNQLSQDEIHKMHQLRSKYGIYNSRSSEKFNNTF